MKSCISTAYKSICIILSSPTQSHLRCKNRFPTQHSHTHIICIYMHGELVNNWLLNTFSRAFNNIYAKEKYYTNGKLWCVAVTVNHIAKSSTRYYFNCDKNGNTITNTDTTRRKIILSIQFSFRILFTAFPLLITFHFVHFHFAWLFTWCSFWSVENTEQGKTRTTRTEDSVRLNELQLQPLDKRTV